jgi:serine/threonine protein kinase
MIRAYSEPLTQSNYNQSTKRVKTEYSITNDIFEKITDQYALTLDCKPALQALSVKKLSDSQTFIKVEKTDRVKTLVALGCSWEEQILHVFLPWIKSLKKKLCNQQTITYPAFFKGKIYENKDSSYSKTCNKAKRIVLKDYALEVHNRKIFYLIPDNFPQFKGSFKVFYVTFNLFNPTKLAYLNSDTTKYSNKKIAQNEENYLIELNGSVYTPNLYASFAYPNQAVFILEHLGIDLFSVVERLTTQQCSLSDRDKLEYTKRLLATLSFFHEKGIVHRDIKPENIMGNEQKTAFIDLGFAARINQTEFIKQGSRGYVAYEILEASESYGRIVPAFDLWSIGCILYLLLAETVYPWYPIFFIKRTLDKESLKEIKELIERYNNLTIPEEYKVAQLLRRLLDINPDRRITAQEAYNEVNQLIAQLPEENTYSIKDQFIPYQKIKTISELNWLNSDPSL